MRRLRAIFSDGKYTVKVYNDEVVYVGGFHKEVHPLCGVSAQVQSGDQRDKISKKRVALGTVIAPGLGTIVGALAKKHVGSATLIIDGQDFQFMLDARDVKKAQRFSVQLNNMVRKHCTEEKVA
jgi:hypothetical protein